VLYGAGGKGREVLRLLREADHEVAAFIDRRAIGTIDGVPVHSPDHRLVADLARGGTTAIVSVFNPHADPLEISQLLSDSGFSRVVGMVELRQMLPVSESYWLAREPEMAPPVEEARWLHGRVSDELSRSVLRQALRLRKFWKPESLRDVVTFDQYLPAGVPLIREEIRFVDGGAFDGDTLEFLSSHGCTFQAFAAFEPDPSNFAMLRRRVNDISPCREVSLWPCGLGRGLDQVRFRSVGNSASKIDDGGDVVVQIVALDEVMPGFHPTYVKLDIEGAEAAALEDMTKTLAESAPALAVCLYHKPPDLWELPRLVDRLLPNSRFYLRAHAWNHFELLLYAVPNKL
jgi:FkbM family methyltransferase